MRVYGYNLAFHAKCSVQLARLIMLGSCLIGFAGQLQAAEKPENEEAARWTWREAAARFEKAGEQLGEERIEDAYQTLLTASKELPPPYNQLAIEHRGNLAALYRERLLTKQVPAHAEKPKIELPKAKPALPDPFGFDSEEERAKFAKADAASRQRQELQMQQRLNRDVSLLCYQLGAYAAALHWERKAAWNDDPLFYEERFLARLKIRCRFECQIQPGDLAELRKQNKLARQFVSLLKLFNHNRAELSAEQNAIWREAEQLRISEKTKDSSRLWRFAQSFYVEVPQGKKIEQQNAFRTLQWVTKLEPHLNSDPDKQDMFCLTELSLNALGDERGVLAWEQRLLERLDAPLEYLAEKIEDRAKKAMWADKLDDAYTDWKLITEKYPETKPYAKAQFLIGRWMQYHQRYPEAIIEYTKLIENKDFSPEADFGNYRHYGMLNVAACHRALGNFEQELDCLCQVRDKYPFRAFWCGVGEGWHEGVLQNRIAACLFTLGYERKVIRQCLEDMKDQKWIGHFRSHLLVKAYRSAGQEADLKAMIKELDALQFDYFHRSKFYKDSTDEYLESRLNTRDLHRYLQIEELIAQGDFDALLKIAQESPHAWDRNLDDPFHGMPGYGLAELELSSPGKAAADALAASGERGLELIAKVESPGPWLMYAVSQSKAPGAIHWLKPYSVRQKYLSPSRLACFAMFQHGKQGKELLRQLVDAYADEKDPPQIATRWLNNQGAPIRSFTQWPQMEQGSLPTKLP